MSAMSDTTSYVRSIYVLCLLRTDRELCSIINSVCKPPKNFDFPEIEKPFWFVSF